MGVSRTYRTDLSSEIPANQAKEANPSIATRKEKGCRVRGG